MNLGIFDGSSKSLDEKHILYDLAAVTTPDEIVDHTDQLFMLNIDGFKIHQKTAIPYKQRITHSFIQPLISYSST
jgi:hypothetical protein